jgi:DmsE family decaheme c-type cytochrome
MFERPLRRKEREEKEIGMRVSNRLKAWRKIVHAIPVGVSGLVLAWGLGFSAANAQELKVGQFALGKNDSVLRGDAKCTSCHDEEGKNGPAVLSIGKTKHGTAADGRTPTCTSCHGESVAHLKKGADGKHPAPDRVFNKTTPSSVQDEACTSCHKGGNRMFWSGSTHHNRGVACATCHDVHNGGHDKARDKKTQTEVCYTCHKEQRAQMNRPSHHPVPEGKMGCSDCHNPHGSAGPKQLKKDSVNETCYQCHMEKRGPFVHNHQPVTEDCTICHNAHGTTVTNLLKSRPPFLCQECHSHTSHPGQLASLPTARTTSTTALGTVGRGCLNCHTNIHGGNSTQNSATAGRFRR